MRLLLLFILCSSLMSFGKSRLPLKYQVVTDQFDSNVHKDSTLITGFVYNDTAAVSGAKISTLNGKVSTMTDETGRYSLTISSQDTALFMFKSGLSEIVLWNYSFQGSHHVELNFYSSYDLYQIEVDKPVIYMYSAEDLKVSVKVNFKGDLAFVYPSMKENYWQVNLSDNQIFIEQERYPYLFWEGVTGEIYFDKKDEDVYGTFVKKDEVVEYLETTLTELGLNSKEKTDFITFWAPKMINQESYFIQFLNQETIDDYFGQLEIKPSPDNLNRIYMLYEGFETIPEVFKSVPQQFEPLQRNGFTVIEWGGSQLNNYSKREL